MPDKKVREVGRLTGGLLIMIALISPLLHLRSQDWTWKAEDYFSRVEEREFSYRKAQADTFSSLINEQAVSYIESTAAELGLEVHPLVELETDMDGLAHIVCVRLDIPYHGALSARITKELGVAPQLQLWDTKETG